MYLWLKKVVKRKQYANVRDDCISETQISYPVIANKQVFKGKFMLDDETTRPAAVSYPVVNARIRVAMLEVERVNG